MKLQARLAEAEDTIEGTYRVFQQVLDGKLLIKISNPCEIRIFQLFVKMIRQIEEELHCLARNASR